MKKTLIAIAALAATSAFAQSSVTIYGQVDSGVYRISDIGTAKKGATVYGDGATFSPILGFKGTEDMGNGLKAGFDFQTDVQDNNGGQNNSGLFRRQANGSIAGGFGEVKLGVTTNPIIATNSALMPTGANGNSVSTSTSSAMAYSDFYTKNAVTYTTPAYMGLTGQIQRGMSNNLDSASQGSVTAYSLAYANGPLEVRYAAQDRKAAASTVTSASNAKIGSSNTNQEVITAPDVNKESSVLGLKYTIGAWSAAGARLQSKKAADAGITTAKTIDMKGNQFGLAYTTGAWTLGGTLTKAEGSKLTVAQARYALSKRTNLIGTYGIADNKASTAANAVNFAPVAFNTGTQPSPIVTGYAGTQGVKSSAMGIALTHSF
jgi:predicted porin